MLFFQSVKTYPLIIAHRGARSIAPENTLAAAQKAIETGADAWELDVQLTSDGVPVIIHDKTLSGTSDIKHINDFSGKNPWPVHKFSLAELRQLDFGSWFVRKDPFGQIAGGAVSEEDIRTFRKIPALTLGEALIFSKKAGFRVNVEIKDLSGLPGDSIVVGKILEIVEASEMNEHVVISSFKHIYLRQSKASNPDISIAALTDSRYSDPIVLLRRLGAEAYHPRSDIINPETVSMLENEGFHVNIWTLNDPASVEKFVKAGISGFFTDFPQRFTSFSKNTISP